MIQDFLAQYPATTQRTYAQVFEDFTALVGTSPQDASQEAVSAYYRAIQDQSSATVHKKLSALRSLIKYLNRRGYRSDDPLLAIRMPRVDRMRSVKYLSEDDVRNVMDSFKRSDSISRFRDEAIIVVLLHGLRLSELTNLNVEDLKENKLWVVGKGDKTRIVPLQPSAITALRLYLLFRQTGPMFVKSNGERIGRRQVQYIVKTLTGIHPHGLRHTFGRKAMRKTGNLAIVQDFLGHSNPATTRIYAQLDTSDLEAALEKINPLGEVDETIVTHQTV